RRERIPAALMLMPEGSAFRGWCPPGMTAGYEAYFRELCRRERLPLVDARTWVGDDGFWDGHHLFPAGAACFSEGWGKEAVQAQALPALARAGFPSAALRADGQSPGQGRGRRAAASTP